MPGYNKYGSITETFLGNPILMIDPLSSKATPPNDINLVAGDFAAAQTLFAADGNNPLDRFCLGDVPRIVGIGIWCNMADGLVQINDPDTFLTGLVLGIQAKSYNSADVLQQNNFIVPAIRYKVQEFNQIQDCDFLLNVSALNYTLTGTPKGPQIVGGYYTLNAFLNATSIKLSSISIDPQYAAKPFYMRPMVVIEHTYPLFFR